VDHADHFSLAGYFQCHRLAKRNPKTRTTFTHFIEPSLCHEETAMTDARIGVRSAPLAIKFKSTLGRDIIEGQHYKYEHLQKRYFSGVYTFECSESPTNQSPYFCLPILFLCPILGPYLSFLPWSSSQFSRKQFPCFVHIPSLPKVSRLASSD